MGPPTLAIFLWFQNNMSSPKMFLTCRQNDWTEQWCPGLGGGHFSASRILPTHPTKHITRNSQFSPKETKWTPNPKEKPLLQIEPWCPSPCQDMSNLGYGWDPLYYTTGSCRHPSSLLVLWPGLASGQHSTQTANNYQQSIYGVSVPLVHSAFM